jgi:hypothetical protein
MLLLLSTFPLLNDLLDRCVFIDALFLTFHILSPSFVEFFVGRVLNVLQSESLYHGLPPLQRELAWMRLYGMLNV